ncbi:TRAFAC clade GTPase domain-containing protein [Bradyrhizobium sp. 13971]
MADLAFVSGRARPFLVGVVGPQNAGKTTLLGAFYLLLGRGVIGADDRHFAGSFSLAGWEAVAGTLRWSPGQPPTFPPHTTSRGGRAPGLLHVSFWDPRRNVAADYLFADAPGEWFQKWSVSRDSPEALGAAWIADRADAFLFTADCELLSGSSMGTARGELQLLARRLAAERGARPVALVWTKTDVKISPEMEKAVRRAVFDQMPDAKEFPVSVMPPEADPLGVSTGLIELFRWMLSIRRPRIELEIPSSKGSDALFSFGASSP